MSEAPSKPCPDFLREQAIDWLVRLRSDQVSDAELDGFAAWLAENSEHAEAFAEADRLFQELAIAARGMPASTQPAPVTSRLGGRILGRTKTSTQRHRRSLWWLASAAALAAWLGIAGLIAPRDFNVLDQLLSDYSTLPGERQAVQLSDGSVLTLDTDTAVSVEFSDRVRSLRLRHGRLHVRVKGEAGRPFEVATECLVVRALGTAFSVAIGEGKEVAVAVDQHAVSLRLADSEPPDGILDPGVIQVREGQGFRHRPGAKLGQPIALDIQQAMAWRDGKLFISDRPLSELLAELERYRLGRIYLADEELRRLRVTGVFSLENPDQALASVRKVLALEETKLGPWWTLLHR